MLSLFCMQGQIPLEKEMATDSSTRAWKIPWMEEPGGYCPWDRKEWDATEHLHWFKPQDVFSDWCFDSFMSVLPCTQQGALSLFKKV